MAALCTMAVTAEEITHAQVVWDYMKIGHDCIKSDIILGLGSYDIRVAEKAASLWLQGMGDHVVFSGNAGKLTLGVWDKSEAEVFRDRAVDFGVPDDKIIIENRSTNTGENVRFVYDILKEKEMLPSTVIIVQKPYMERRAFATFVKQWPGDVSKMKVCVTSPDVGLLDYPSSTTGSLQDVISVLVGDFARIGLYEEKGFQIHQDVPDSVQKSFEFLVQTKRFDSHLPT